MIKRGDCLYSVASFEQAQGHVAARRASRSISSARVPTRRYGMSNDNTQHAVKLLLICKFAVNTLDTRRSNDIVYSAQRNADDL